MDTAIEDTNLVEQEELMSSFRELPLEEKRKELGWEIAEMQLMLNTLITDLVPDYPAKPQEDYDNLFDGTTSEDEYLAGLYEDVIDLKDTFGNYCDVVTSAYYDEEETEE